VTAITSGKAVLASTSSPDGMSKFAMFGIALREHDERYEYSAEWVSILKKIYAENEPFDHLGKYFNLRNVGGKPRPWGKWDGDTDECGFIASRA